MVNFLGKPIGFENQKGLGLNFDSQLERSCNYAHARKLSTVCFFLSHWRSYHPHDKDKNYRVCLPYSKGLINDSF